MKELKTSLVSYHRYSKAVICDWSEDLKDNWVLIYYRGRKEDKIFGKLDSQWGYIPYKCNFSTVYNDYRLYTYLQSDDRVFLLNKEEVAKYMM